MSGPPIKYHTEEERRLGRNRREVLRRERNLEKFQAYQKEYQEKNKERIEISRKRRYFRDKEERLLYSKNWVIENRDKYRESKRNNQRKRLKEDKIYKFDCTIRSLISYSFRKVNLNKNKKTEKILGCTLNEFRSYILSLCPKNVELKDFHRYGYHIDHKIPISLAKTEEDVIRLCHYTNLQPLWCVDNIKKSNKINL